MEKLISTIGIIGYGRFGGFVHKTLKDKCPHSQIKVAEIETSKVEKDLHPIDEVCKCNIVIPCVPIKCLEKTIRQTAGLFEPDSVIFDVSSVKLFSKKVYENVFSDSQGIILSHPLFGPATLKERSGNFSGLTITLENHSAEEMQYQTIKSFLTRLGIEAVEISAEEHDKAMAHSHFLAVFSAELLRRIGFKTQPIATESAKALSEFVNMIGVDSEFLKDLYEFNPYAKDVYLHLKKVTSDLFKEIEE